MSMLKEFKEFASKGNAIDMAVGIIVGAGFGKIVNSLVNDVIMPPLGMIIGGVDFKNLKITLKAANFLEPAVTLNIGVFINTVVDFTIVAFTIYIMIKAMKKIKADKKEEQIKGEK
ncbi:MAG: large-conductance mechanosensitive channel [Candidatus Firestonebacteria bacterium RIFOXYC2_FULL_39_67]|nr:MAG: large-conductance mechanosensitive channel [Candidatus Firestonebacteria bacterium RIFOXYD2_FULL_39_29]OGF53038.1 MAG: large-conductance mechanosensitive channel [Candidatus Firestonebacteria bacterium RifOxyC12_full_39_7]OGF54506.1 MAG: large-conductance mechanosensitive channel [Candidatus Firestonebacteria bacterium RIFOXYC2_FULL_39_67]